ncbi:hypothetical protein AAVH_19113 [Aphelenchoides avenae]|nr:hypothetical protein AAVH_19113 [Aphelenchus avenae]
MYVPRGDAGTDLFCALPFPKNTKFVAQKENYMGASYFIKWTENPTPPDVLRSRIDFIRNDRSNEDITWNTIFEQHEDTCDHVQLMMDSSTLGRSGSYLGQTYTREASGFTAVLAVRCTNEFVWYELGWRYYAAAVTTASDYVISRADGEYSNSCGQLIFLP